MLTDLISFDQLYIQENTVLCGIDEAGRGPLAGPVCAACVCLPTKYCLDGLNDSKKLTEKQRNHLYHEIIDQSIPFGIGWANHEEIDDLNILNATFLAMNRAYNNLCKDFHGIIPNLALVDGNRDPKLSIQTQLVVKGDAKSASIAAASVIAKVSRDNYMLELSQQYPQYQFEKHKGYPTKLHYDMIKKYGICPVHRLSFLKNLEEHL